MKKAWPYVMIWIMAATVALVISPADQMSNLIATICIVAVATPAYWFGYRRGAAEQSNSE